MTQPQFQTLLYCEKECDAGRHPDLHGRKTHEWTIWSLRDRNWIDGDFRITDAGRAALARDRDGRLF